jgi:hypothetical protein
MKKAKAGRFPSSAADLGQARQQHRRSSIRYSGRARRTRSTCTAVRRDRRISQGSWRRGAERGAHRGPPRPLPAHAQGSEHFFFNETKDEEGLVIGFYVGAKNVADTGYEFRGTSRCRHPDAAPQRLERRHADAHRRRRSWRDGRGGRVGRSGGARNRSGVTTAATNMLAWVKLAPGATHQKQSNQLERDGVLRHRRSWNWPARVRTAWKCRRAFPPHPARGRAFPCGTSARASLWKYCGSTRGAGSFEEAGYIARVWTAADCGGIA